LGFEVLEDRRMLAGIVWANADAPNYAPNYNNFDTAFDIITPGVGVDYTLADQAFKVLIRQLPTGIEWSPTSITWTQLRSLTSVFLCRRLELTPK